MEPLLELFKLDVIQWFMGLFIIMLAVISVFNIVGKFSEIIGKPLKWAKQSAAHDKAIQGLAESIKTLTEGQKIRDEKIEALITGNKEILGNIIDEKYEKYITLGGIPANDADEFEDIYTAYKKLKGNHRRDFKYNYVKTHLPVIPVETKLIIPPHTKTKERKTI